MSPLLLAFALAQELPAAGLDGAAQVFYARAESQLVAGEYASAAALYRLVLGADPSFTPASLGLARALEAQGDLAGAEAVWRSLGTEPDAVEALARLVEPRDPAEALRGWRLLQSLRMGDPVPWREEARLLAEADPDAAQSAWRHHRALLLGAEPDGTVLAAIAEVLVRAGRAGEAEALLQEVVDAYPEGVHTPELRRRLDRLGVERAAEGVGVGGSEPLSVAAQVRLRAGHQRLREGEVDGAEAIARELVAAAPRSAEARGFLADVLLAREDLGGAEVQASLARQLAPEEAAHHLRLAALLRQAYGGRRDAEAVAELRDAAALRPGDAEVHARLAEAEQAVGAVPEAIASWERALAASRDPAVSEAARTAIAALRRAPPGPVLLPAPAVPPLPEEVARPYRIALVYVARGQLDAARAELDAALAVAPDTPVLLNLRARLLRRLGDEAGAVLALDRSLAVDPTQGPILLTRGEIAAAAGDETAAERWYRAAAEHGAGDAHYLLARLAEGRGDWSAVRLELDAWSATAPSASLYAPGAAALRGELERRDRRRVVGAVLGGLAVVGLPLGWWIRRRTAATLADLARVPEVAPQVARHLAALRHEALKHRATVLPEVATALEAGDEGPWRQWLADAPVVIERLDATIDALESLGRPLRLRLALRDTDPVLAPLHRALRAAARDRVPTPGQVRVWSQSINQGAYAALGAVVHGLASTVVDPPAVERVYARVGGEPGFAGAQLPELPVEVEGTPPRVSLFAADLDDILANLLRNALAAGAGALSVRVETEVDPITGTAEATIRLRDDAPGVLTNAMIRGRSISRGLGLAADLVHRSGGTLKVEPAGEGVKVVVVRLPALEDR